MTSRSESVMKPDGSQTSTVRRGAVKQRGRFCKAVALIAATLSLNNAALGQDALTDSAPGRPDINFYRWQEDWSFLADPANRTEFGDELKYVSLDPSDRYSYLSFGLTLRERIESKDSPLFGLAHLPSNETYLYNRLLLHADFHFNESARLFVQLGEESAPGLAHPGPADEDRLDLALAFLDFRGDLGEGEYKVRLGRQEMAFDLQRFISVREGANVRQAYDAAWGDYEIGDWRWTAFVSQPVQDRDVRYFDDFSNHHYQYDGTRIQKKGLVHSALSLTLSRYVNDSAHFPAASGQEQRFIADARVVGKDGGFDWDSEAMFQTGYVGEKRVAAWAIGNLAGYTLEEQPLKPRLGIQLDAASGNRNPNGDSINTFNPLFPNGYYVTLSAYTGYSNFIHLKPSLTLSPRKDVTLLAAVGALWRETTADAVYSQPDIPVPGTFGLAGRYTATYAEARADWKVSRSVALALEEDYYVVSDALKSIGAKNSNYVGLEFRYGW